MRYFFYLSSCDSCKRIMKTLDLDDSIECIDIKKNPLTEHQLELLFQRTQSYEALFNKRAQRYKQRGLKDQVLSDTDYGELLSDHYTFLKRPVLLYEKTIFIGNSPKVVEAAKTFLDEQ
ncbi:MAG: ArsC/Spx/MgsR family protein [Flavobacteriaceae bacterium]|nr:ArsC/Spx/MgsR family protein [Flavobacteriaceae bacterium]MDG2386578.1 ArsC/Spx/MgsR family protein [Flavobacteriaceae bacterium]